MSTKRIVARALFALALLAVASLFDCRCNTEPVAWISYSPSSPKVGETVRLDGTGSSDPDGDIIMRYEWSVSGPPGSSPNLSDTLGSVVSLTTNAAGHHNVTLLVSDGDFEGIAGRTVVFRDPSLANVGPDLTADVGATVPLDGSASFDLAGRPLTYTWSRIAGIGTIQLDNANQVVAEVVFAEPDIHAFQLHVRAGTSGAAFDTLLVTANPPQISDVRPDSGDIGTVVDIMGKNFSSILTGNVVAFSGIEASVSAAS